MIIPWSENQDWQKGCNLPKVSWIDFYSLPEQSRDPEKRQMNHIASIFWAICKINTIWEHKKFTANGSGKGWYPDMLKHTIRFMGIKDGSLVDCQAFAKNRPEFKKNFWWKSQCDNFCCMITRQKWRSGGSATEFSATKSEQSCIQTISESNRDHCTRRLCMLMVHNAQS